MGMDSVHSLAALFPRARGGAARGAANPGRAGGGQRRRFLFAEFFLVESTAARCGRARLGTGSTFAATRSQHHGHGVRRCTRSSFFLAKRPIRARPKFIEEKGPLALSRCVFSARARRSRARRGESWPSGWSAAPAISVCGILFGLIDGGALRPSAARYGVDFRRHPIATSWAWYRLHSLAAFFPRARGGAERGAANPGRAVGAQRRRFLFAEFFLV